MKKGERSFAFSLFKNPFFFPLLLPHLELDGDYKQESDKTKGVTASSYTESSSKKY